MEKILISKNSYKECTKEEYKIVVKVEVTQLDEDKVEAVLKIKKEHNWQGGKVIMDFNTAEDYRKIFTKIEVNNFKNSITLPEGTDMYDVTKLVELETAKLVIEQDKLLAMNGVDLLASDFEITTTTQTLS